MAVENRKRWMRRSSAWQAGLSAWATYRVSGSRNRPTPPTWSTWAWVVTM